MLKQCTHAVPRTDAALDTLQCLTYFAMPWIVHSALGYLQCQIINHALSSLQC